jgi:hypothetical protein
LRPPSRPFLLPVPGGVVISGACCAHRRAGARPQSPGFSPTQRGGRCEKRRKESERAGGRAPCPLLGYVESFYSRFLASRDLVSHPSLSLPPPSRPDGAARNGDAPLGGVRSSTRALLASSPFPGKGECREYFLPGKPEKKKKGQGR